MAIVEADPKLGAQIVADAKEHVLYSWSVQSQIDPIPVAGAQGRHFWDYDGKRYLDFASQLVNVSIGHQHPKIIQAIKDQADQLCTIGPPLASESRSTLGRMLAEVTPGDLSVSFFTNGGAEANENAVKLARLATGRNKIIARYRSYHGATNGAVTSTGAAKAIGLVLPHLQGKVDGISVRAPVPTGSITDLVVTLRGEATADSVNAAFEAAADSGPLAPYLDYSTEPLVSRDIVHSPASCIFDSELTMASGSFAKVFGWYDNEWGYSCRLVDLVSKLL